MKLRVANPPAWSGRWVVQYFDPAMNLWFDYGDPVDTLNEAAAKLRRVAEGEA